LNAFFRIRRGQSGHVKVTVVYLKMLIFKAKINTIPLALNIII